MPTASTSQVVIRLVPVASRASSIVAAGFSLALHGGVVALAMVLGHGTWRPHTPSRIARPTPIVRFVALGPNPARPWPGAIPPGSLRSLLQ